MLLPSFVHSNTYTHVVVVDHLSINGTHAGERAANRIDDLRPPPSFFCAPNPRSPPAPTPQNCRRRAVEIESGGLNFWLLQLVVSSFVFLLCYKFPLLFFLVSIIIIWAKGWKDTKKRSIARGDVGGGILSIKAKTEQRQSKSVCQQQKEKPKPKNDEAVAANGTDET